MKTPVTFSALALSLVAAFSTLPAKELEGVYLPTQNPCPSPEEAIKKMTVPPGYEVRCFASEPMIVNPVAMTWDHRGRLWCVELYEYPLGAKKPNEYSKTATDENFRPVPKGEGPNWPRDRVVVLEDTDNDGVADKRTVFVDGLSLATGILCGEGGVFVGQAPNLFFFRDTDGDDKADDYKTVLTGFGLEDRHELLNSFTWGPDGYMYFTHGVFTHSKVRRPGEPVEKGNTLNAGIYRVKFGSGRVGVPPGASVPRNGERNGASDGARDEASDSRLEAGNGGQDGHPTPSGPTVVRHEVFADGTSNPWGCDYDAAGNWFVEACVIDHLFHMAPGGLYQRQGGAPENPYAYELLPSIVNHKHFRAAYAGIQVYQGGRYPEDTWGHLFFGNIHDNAIHEEKVEPVGATFKASPVRDFLRANDGWFRPVSIQTGPDGFLWVMDWCDKYPCYQNAQANPEGVDRDKGRIWRICSVVPPSGGNGATKPAEAGTPMPSRPEREMDFSKMSPPELKERRSAGNSWIRRMARQWGGSDAEERSLADIAARCGSPDPKVRHAAAVDLRVRTGGALTANRPDSAVKDEFAVLAGAFEPLLRGGVPAGDKLLPFSIWMALEPALASSPAAWTPWLASLAPETKPLSQVLTYKTMRRLCDTREPANLDLALDYLDKVGTEGDLVATALDGLVKGQEAAAIKPTRDAAPYFAKWSKHEREDVRKFAQQLATLWGDPNAIGALIGTALTDSAALDARIKAVQTVRKLKNDQARGGIAKLLDSKTPDELTTEVLRAAAELGGRNFPDLILKAWAGYPPALKNVAAEVLTSRSDWSNRLLDAVEGKWVTSGKLEASALPVTVRRYFATQAPDDQKQRAKALLGAWNESAGNVKALIAKKRAAALQGEPNLANGKAVFTATCAVCHKFHGGGQEVGPELIGSGRSSLDALLNNVIDPNQIIGNGYQNITVQTKDGRTLSGRVTEDTPTRVSLLGIGAREEVVARDQIAEMKDTGVSVMPSGFGELPDDVFRDLIWYILAPPEEGPLTKEKKDALSAPVTEGTAAAAPPTNGGFPRIDWESVSLWNPEWKVVAPEFEGTPVKLPEFRGRKNVLKLHPFDGDRTKPGALERKLAVSAEKPGTLKFAVAAHDQGDFELVVRIDGKEAVRQLVKPGAPGGWADVSVPLAPWKGREVLVRLENHANNWEWEFSHWADVRVE